MRNVFVATVYAYAMAFSPRLSESRKTRRVQELDPVYTSTFCVPLFSEKQKITPAWVAFLVLCRHIEPGITVPIVIIEPLTEQTKSVPQDCACSAYGKQMTFRKTTTK